MPARSEIDAQLARESERRRRLAVPAFGAGFLYLLSGIIISETLRPAPTVGILQGLAPAIRGVASPALSPRTAEVKFISHHAFGLVAGSTLAAISIGILTLILLVLLDAGRFRRPQMWPGFLPLVIGGGIALSLVSIGHQAVAVIEAHRFAIGHDFSNSAVDNALTNGAANVITDYLDLFAGLAVAVGMIGVTLNAMRVGLLPRWMGFLGMFVGLLIFLPIGGAELEVVPAFWMVMVGVLYAGKWPNGEPAAWQAGEARPWPPRGAPRGAPRAGVAQPALSAAGADVAPAAQPPSKTGSRKRRRKRGR